MMLCFTLHYSFVTYFMAFCLTIIVWFDLIQLNVFLNRICEVQILKAFCKSSIILICNCVQNYSLAFGQEYCLQICFRYRNVYIFSQANCYCLKNFYILFFCKHSQLASVIMSGQTCTCTCIMLCFIVLHLYTFLYVIVINTNLCLAGVRFPFGQELNTVSLSMVYIRNCKCIHPALDFVLFFRKRSHAFCCLCVCTYCFSFYVYYYLLHFLIFGLDFFLLHDPV